MLGAQGLREAGGNEYVHRAEGPPLSHERFTECLGLARGLAPDDVISGPHETGEIECGGVDLADHQPAGSAAASVASAVLYTGPSTIRPSKSSVASPRARAAS